MDKLRKRHVVVVGVVCIRGVGSQWIIFFPTVKLLVPYGAIFSRARLTWVMLRRVVDLFACCSGLSSSP